LKVYYGIDIHTAKLFQGGADMVLRKIHETSVPNSIQQQLRKESYTIKWSEMVRSFFSKIELNKVIEDMAIYGQDLLSAEQNNEPRLQSLNYFKSMFEPNEVIVFASND
jgi:hypothetical protein